MRPSLLITAVFLIATPSFGAGLLSYTLNPASSNAAPGDTVELVATLQNVGDATLFVNDLSVVFSAQATPYLSLNPFFSFFDNVPGTFETTDPAWTGSIEQILVDPSTPFGTYTGTATILGGATQLLFDPATDGIGTQPFTIVVVSPEPGSIGLMAIGLLAVAGYARRSLARRATGF